MSRTVIRASLIDVPYNPATHAQAARFVQDGFVAIEEGCIRARGEWSSWGLQARAGDVVLDYHGYLLTPGFIDAHIHLPQVDVIASPAPGLLHWLNQHTFPAEAAFADTAHCQAAAQFFLDQLICHGTTSACVLGSVHAQSVEALFTQAEQRQMRLAAGKCLMDSHCPEFLRDEAEQGVQQSAELAARWHGRGRLSYAITPRFAGSSSARQLQLAGELAQARPELLVQTHLAENQDEVRWIAELFPQARSYLDVYEQAGLLREKSLYAHCIWLDDQDRARMTAHGATAVVCPTSNLFLGSGLFDFAAAADAGMHLALATDVGAGQSFSMLSAMRSAHEVARLRGIALSATQLWYWATRSAALAAGWPQLGTLEPGAEADLVLLNPCATPLLARRSAQAASLEALLFAMIVLADDRAVKQVWIAGQAVQSGSTGASVP